MISVIIPVHNSAATLRRCLESLHGAPGPERECIVVDDGSGDGSADVADSWGARVVRLEERGGAAQARNRGAEVAQGEILLFLDADVEVHPDCLSVVEHGFHEHPEVSALFGSYDDHPGRSNFLSQYRNLFHHYIHQTSKSDASTFWTACGAIQRNVFFEVGKFDEDCRMMEDIELGYKLKARGHRILLHKGLLVKHLKRYSLGYLLKADLWDRAVPWTLLILSRRRFIDDMNLKLRYKVSAVLLILWLVVLAWRPEAGWLPWMLAGAPVLILLLNYDVYDFFRRKRGILFSLKAVPLHLLYYLCSTLGFVIGLGIHFLRRPAADRPPAV